jgi:hypothetical protein
MPSAIGPARSIDCAGNLPLFAGIFPDHKAPIVRRDAAVTVAV